ncbi:MAG: protein translocase subunit SecD [Clostridia bacterium]|nr:protein translocase subunit SecD [Clostridia bacterium]
MKTKSIVKFIAVFVVILLMAYVAIFGFECMGKVIPASFDEYIGIERGFDLAGGSVIVFEPTGDGSDNVSDDDISASISALRLRLDAQGLNDAVVSAQGSDVKRIRVEIPAETNPEKAIEYLGSVAKLSFYEVTLNSQTNQYEKVGEELLSGDHVEKAYPGVGQNNDVVVNLEFTSAGKDLFADATSRLVGKPLGIFVDDILISAPNVNQPITEGYCYIEGGFTNEDAKQLANQIQSGALPFALKAVSQNSVGAQLGDDALNKSLTAGAIGLLLVMLYMIIMYRMCGLVADIALVGYTALVFLIINGTGIQLTLPGIAGIILTIGTAVDANVVIFERIKEELKTGKTLRASVDAGFNRALTAIIDSNITTIIAAVVLWYFGTGTIIGFAKTLFVGTLVSMFSAIFVTKFLLRQLVGFGIKNPKLYSA